MKRMTATIAIALITALPAQAGLITKNVIGTVSATSGSGADVGAGEVTGFVEYDDATGQTGFLGDLFDLTDFALNFSNGPMVTILDDPSAQIEVDTSGDLVAVSLFAFGLSGFGLVSPIDIQFDGFSTNFFFSDQSANVVAEGSISFEPSQAVPEPSTSAAFGFGLVLAALFGRPRRTL